MKKLFSDAIIQSRKSLYPTTPEISYKADDYREIGSLEIRPPDVWRYFVRVKPEVLKVVGYAEDVARYYQLEDFRAHAWIAHQRYPTKGRVWHPAGAHPFVGLDEALVHNGDFANYYSVTEYLRQRNLYPHFQTDTEGSALIFDLLNRVYGYPLEYIIEALAPTSEMDFDQLPPEKQEIYRLIQTIHIHGSPDGPWFFIIARRCPSRL
jgi:hypothetical protein